MHILVLGSGAREHAIVTRLLADTPRPRVTCAPGNAGIARDATTVEVDPLDGDAVVSLTRKLAPDLVVVGPEAPLVAGVTDAVRAAGFPVFGPDAAAARIEGSKAFAKDVMAAAGVPTGRDRRCTTIDDVAAALDEFGAPHVVKADGLAAGKGVVVTSDREAALAHARRELAAGPVLVEEYLAGEEVSLFFLSDGRRAVPLSPAQDYKRALDDNQGPNTGGMGSYSPLPWLPAGFVDDVRVRIAQPTVDELRRRGTPFVGLLYCGLVVTADGVKVIEFNARFGDPETQVVLPRLSGDFGGLLLAAATGRLDTATPPVFDDDRVAVGVVLASEGYPGHPLTGRAITGVDDAASMAGVHIDHAATATTAGGLVSTGGRVLTVVATATSFSAARTAAYAAIERIHLEGSHYRRDIARKVTGE